MNKFILGKVENKKFNNGCDTKKVATIWEVVDNEKLFFNSFIIPNGLANCYIIEYLKQHHLLTRKNCIAY